MWLGLLILCSVANPSSPIVAAERLNALLHGSDGCRQVQRGHQSPCDRNNQDAQQRQQAAADWYGWRGWRDAAEHLTPIRVHGGIGP